jgi:hypothetical protein
MRRLFVLERNGFHLIVLERRYFSAHAGAGELDAVGGMRLAPAVESALLFS